jgi:PIN domain nuclease of toxin-antitoxin system
VKLLVDTHVLIWIILNPEKLSERTVNLFLDRRNQIFLSIVSIWEMQIKLQIGKLSFELPLSELIESQQKVNNLQISSITTKHIYSLEGLPNYHRDPFDRLLIAQAIVESMPVLSIDVAFDAYPMQRIW